MRLLFAIVGNAVLLAGCATGPSMPGEPVPPDVALLRGTFVAGTQPDGNSVLLRGRNGLVVVDTGRHPAHAARIADAARAMQLPITTIVNTHWHLDHVAGNVALRAAFPQAQVHAGDAIDAARRGFLADYRAQLVQLLSAQPDVPASADWRAEIERIDAVGQLRPTHVVNATVEYELAGRRVRLGLERNAVSGGDVWLLDHASGTLVAGDLVTLPAPLFDTACVDGWRDALGRLDALEFRQLVPGHGAVLTRAQFDTYRVAFERLLDCAASGAESASCRAGWLRDAGPLISQQDLGLAGSLLDYYVGQVLRAPPARRARHCRAESQT